MSQGEVQRLVSTVLANTEKNSYEIMDCINNIDSIVYVLEAIFDPGRMCGANNMLDINKVHPLIALLSENADVLRGCVISVENELVLE